MSNSKRISIYFHMRKYTRLVSYCSSEEIQLRIPPFHKATLWPEKPIIRRSINQTVLCSLELRRFNLDLILCYKIVFGMVNVSFNDFFLIWHALKNKGSCV